MLKHRTLFLDLEDTVIDEFGKGFSAGPKNIPAVRRLIREFQPHSVRIFSFAIQNETDALNYGRWFQGWLQDLLEVPLDTPETVFRVDQHLRQVIAGTRTRFESPSDYILTMGKTLGFFQHLDLGDLRDSDVLLVDDMVKTGTTFSWETRNLSAKLINVGDLKVSD